MGRGRAYFAVQALAGAAWWIAVFLSPVVRTATLGDLDPVLVAALDIPLFVVASALAALGMRVAAVIATGWTVLVTILLAVYATVTTLAGWGVLLMLAAAAASTVALLLMLLGRVPTEWVVVGPFRFREADRTAPTRRHVAATTAQIIVFWGAALGIVPLVISAAEHRWGLAVELPLPVVFAGAVLFVVASALGIWAAVVMSTLGAGTPLPSATATRFVVAGPYRFVRNPMAVAGIAQGVAVGLMLSSWLVVVYAVCGSLVWNVIIRPHEERDLDARFGEDFRAYRDEVRCWWPRLRPVAASVAARV